jgi:hypothetical protein
MVTKKATQKKAPAKRKSSTTHKKATKSVDYISFKVTPNKRPFITFELTRQTVYWGLIGAAILFLGTYVVYLQIKVSEIYDQVDSNSSHIELTQQDLQKIQESNNR